MCCDSRKISLEKIVPQKIAPRNIAPQKIASEENSPENNLLKMCISKIHKTSPNPYKKTGSSRICMICRVDLVYFQDFKPNKL